MTATRNLPEIRFHHRDRAELLQGAFSAEFAEAMRDARTRAGLKQADLKEKCGITKFKAYEMENGTIRTREDYEAACGLFPELLKCNPFEPKVPAPPPSRKNLFSKDHQPDRRGNKKADGTAGPAAQAAQRPQDIVRLLARSHVTEDIMAVLRLAKSCGYSLDDLAGV